MLGESACVYVNRKGDILPIRFISTRGNKWFNEPAADIKAARDEVPRGFLETCRAVLKASCHEARQAFGPDSTTGGNNSMEKVKGDLNRMFGHILKKGQKSTPQQQVTEGERQ